MKFHQRDSYQKLSILKKMISNYVIKKQSKKDD